MSRLSDDFMTVDYSKKNLQNASFANEKLVNTSFMESDLRGADFSNADLTGADLTRVKTGITPVNTAIIFMIAIVISMASSYGAMLAGTTVQTLIKSEDMKIKASGFASMFVILGFIFYYYLKGGLLVIKHLLLPIISLAILGGIIAYYSGIGTGKGMFFLAGTLLMVVIMVVIGTLARALAGMLSYTIIFILVASAGSIFGASIGGGISATILALSCVLISKRALSGTKGFGGIRKIATIITVKWGTSFRNANLTNADFRGAIIYNADFTDADLSLVNWGDAKKENCTP
jgi:hypothetical protein